MFSLVFFVLRIITAPKQVKKIKAVCYKKTNQRSYKNNLLPLKKLPKLSQYLKVRNNEKTQKLYTKAFF